VLLVVGSGLRLNRALRTLSAGNRRLLRTSNEQELLQAMCRVIVHDGGYRGSVVRYARQDEQKTLALEAYALPTDTDPHADAWIHSTTFSWAD